MGLLTRHVAEYVSSMNSIVGDYMKFEKQAEIADATLLEFKNVNADLSSWSGVTLTLEILKVAEVKDLLRYLAKTHDLHIIQSPEKKTYGAAGWTWKLGRNGTDANFRVTATFKDAPEATCRMVKVGTKTVEQDVYEMKCDNGDISEVENLDADLEAVEEDLAAEAAAEAETEDHDPRELGQ